MLCSRVTMPTLWPGHQRAVLDIAVDHRAAQRAGPEMLDLELRVLLRQLAAVEPVDDLALRLAEPLGRRVGQRAHRNDRKARVELDRRHRVARRGADEGLLEARVGDRFVGADEPRAELHARRRPSPDRTSDRLAAADAAGDEYRHLGQMRQDLLRQHRGRDRPDMAAGLAALDDDRVGARCAPACGRSPAPARSRRRGRRRRAGAGSPRRGGRPPASTTWPTRCGRGRHRSARTSCGCIVIRLTPNGRAVSARGGGDLGVEQVGRHRAARRSRRSRRHWRSRRPGCAPTPRSSRRP